jgi:hypothetical protein
LLTHALSTAEIANHLGVSRWTADRLVRAELPAIPGSRLQRVSIAAYVTWLNTKVTGQENGEMQTAVLPDLIPFEDVAASYRKSVRAVKEHTKARNLAHIVIGRSYFFTAGQLEAFLETHTKQAAAVVAKDAMRDRRARRHPQPRRTAA